MEPYDDSMPEILKNQGVYTHLVSDHQHYWEDGGGTYHTRYSSWEISRGQEGDPWKADLSYEYAKDTVFDYKRAAKSKMHQYPQMKRMLEHDEINRMNMNTEEKTSQALTFANGLEFIKINYKEDHWFLQIETFDPHEPFYTMPEDRALYPHTFKGDSVELDDDWPVYMPAVENEEVISHVRYNYAALVTKCDRYLGKVLDMMDQYHMWDDTMLIVNTDHGFLLGEHGWWGKSAMPVYEEIAHIPLYVYDPRRTHLGGVKRDSVVQTMDLAPTLLEYFGMEIPKDMEGRPLGPVMDEDKPIRPYAVFGYHGKQINVTDGHYLYTHTAEHQELPFYEYTLMPTHMRSMFSPQELQDIELVEPFSFTKGCRLMKIQADSANGTMGKFHSALYDLQKNNDKDIKEECPELVENMKQNMIEFMKKNEAPKEVFLRYGIAAIS